MRVGEERSVRCDDDHAGARVQRGDLANGSLQVPLGGFRMPGAGFFPLTLGLSLAALALMLLGVNLLSPGAGQTGYAGSLGPLVPPNHVPYATAPNE